jgi:hypothetical protein
MEMEMNVREQLARLLDVVHMQALTTICVNR